MSSPSGRRRCGELGLLRGGAPQLPLGFVPIAGLGAAFAALYEWRESLIPGMVAHAASNALVFLFLTLIPSRG